MCVPVIIVRSVRRGSAVRKKTVVVLDVHVMDLNPNTWHVDRVHVRRKAAVRVEDVLADVAPAAVRVGTVLSRFRQKTLPEIVVVDFGEQLRILVDARYSK